MKGKKVWEKAILESGTLRAKSLQKMMRTALISILYAAMTSGTNFYALVAEQVWTQAIFRVTFSISQIKKNQMNKVKTENLKRDVIF